MVGIGVNWYNMSDSETLTIYLQDIYSKEQLLRTLSDKLHFPDYFGHNWDALFDCLSDLGWINEQNIVIAHATIPELYPKDLVTYRELLVEAANRLESAGAQKLTIIWPG